MRIGANVGYFGQLAGPEADLEFAVVAERLGYHSLWVGEPYGNDAPTVLAWFAGATSSILLGSGIMAIPGRTPAMTAQTAMTLDHVSSGRFILGLGTSGPQVSEGWHGVPFEKPLQWTREYVEIVRMALRREKLVYDGERFTLPLPGGPGKPLKLILEPLRADLPIYLAAMGPKNVMLAGEIADGWLPLWFAPEHADDQLSQLRAGTEKAGRASGAVRVCPSVFSFVHDDLEWARNLMRPALALYIGGMGSREQNFYNRLIAGYGFEDAARTIQNLYLDGKQMEAAAAVPDDLVDMVCLCGPLERVADRMAAYRHAGVDELIAIPAGLSAEGRLEQLALLTEAAERSGVIV